MKTKSLINKLKKEGCKIEHYDKNITAGVYKGRSVTWVDQDGNAVAVLGFIGTQDVTHAIYTIKHAVEFLKRGQ